MIDNIRSLDIGYKRYRGGISSSFIVLYLYSCMTGALLIFSSMQNLSNPNLYYNNIIFMFLFAAWHFFFRPKPEFKRITLIKIIYLMVFAYFLVIMAEILQGHDMLLFTLPFYINYLIALLLVFIAVGCIRRYRYALITAAILVFIISIVNHYMIIFKNASFEASDIFAAQTAFNVVSGFEFEMNLEVWTGLYVLVSLLFVAFSLKGVKIKNLNYGALLVAALLIYSIVENELFIDKYENFFTNQFSTVEESQNNGFLANFTRSLESMFPEKPEHYATKIDELISEKKDMKISKTKTNVKNPNIVVIMNESFTDFSVLGELGYEEPIPFFKSLMNDENAVSGYLNVEVYGGGTANSEYEFLTSNTPSLLLENSYPLQQYCKKPVSSIAWLLKEQGYDTTGIHPFWPNGWNRNGAYPNLGFDEFISIEDMDQSDENMVRNFIGDAANYQYVLNILKDKKSPQFIFNVTMQNHGGYQIPYDHLKKEISIDQNVPQRYEIEQFANLMRESDYAFKNFVNEIKKMNTPTIILMFGDHQPAIQDYVDYRLQGVSQQEYQFKTHAVPFVIWANYDIDSYDAGVLSPKYLAPILLENTGLKLTPYYEYLLDLKTKIPVLNGNMLIDANNHYYNPKKDNPYNEEVEEYRILEYKNAFGNDYLKSDYFSLLQK